MLIFSFFNLTEASLNVNILAIKYPNQWSNPGFELLLFS